jgi:hypothetical protein
MSTIKFSNSNGYLVFRLTNLAGKERNFRVNRIVYLAHNPEWDIFDVSKDNFIDHIDRVPTNNNIENLRVVTQQQNNFNRSASGVYKKKNRFYAYINKDYKMISLGGHSTYDSAHQAYLDAKKIHHAIPNPI